MISRLRKRLPITPVRSDRLRTKQNRGINVETKYQQLLDNIAAYNKHVGVCVSGGSDSTLVLIAAAEALGADRVTAITANTAFITGDEMSVAEELAKKLGVVHLKPRVFLMQNEKITRNDAKKCIYCKRDLVGTLSQVAVQNNIMLLLDGAHASVAPDNKISTHDGVCVMSPLRDAKITRLEIEQILKDLGFSKYIRPASSCLAARIATGDPITIKKLRWLRAAENYIMSLGFDFVWVHVTGMDADVQVPKSDVARLLRFEEEIRAELLDMGYRNVTINPEGYKKISQCIC